MANTYFNILTRGLESSLANLAIEDGKIRFTTDSGKLYVEHKAEGEETGSRIQITDFVKGNTEEQIKAILAPTDKFYLASDTHHVFIYDNAEWVDVTDQEVSKAKADSLGQTISETYIKSISNVGGVFTFTKGDNTTSQLDTGLAPLASPVFTGNPQAPTIEDLNDASNKIATTAFVQSFVQKAIEDYSNGTLVVSSAIKSTNGGTEPLYTSEGDLIGFKSGDLNAINRANAQAAKDKEQDEKIKTNADNITVLQNQQTETNDNVAALAKATTQFGTVDNS